MWAVVASCENLSSTMAPSKRSPDVGARVDSGWPTAADLERIKATVPAFTLNVAVPVSPSHARKLWADPETAKRTNPLIERVVVHGRSSTSDGELVSFTVTDRIKFCCCFSVPVRFPAVFWTSTSSAKANELLLYSRAPAGYGVTVINQWTFSANGAGTTVRQDTYVTAPALLRAYVINTARSAHSEGLQKNVALLKSG